MRCSWLRVAFLIVGSPVVTGQGSVSKQPKINLELPSGFPSESVQINYLMTGGFGGYGSLIKPEKGKSTYEIIAGVDGKPARRVKIIAYMPGCEIVTLAIAVEDAAVSRALRCKPLKLIHLRGQITPNVIQQSQPAEVEVAYLASWDHGFYGIEDGMVTSIHIATVIPTSGGRFEVDVPDLYSQKLGEGEFQLTLRAAKTWNLIAYLKTSGNAFGLAVQSSYPSLVTFKANRP